MEEKIITIVSNSEKYFIRGFCKLSVGTTGTIISDIKHNIIAVVPVDYLVIIDPNLNKNDL
jgi:hypothetical protein